MNLTSYLWLIPLGFTLFALCIGLVAYRADNSDSPHASKSLSVPDALDVVFIFAAAASALTAWAFWLITIVCIHLTP